MTVSLPVGEINALGAASGSRNVIGERGLAVTEHHSTAGRTLSSVSGSSNLVGRKPQ